MKKSGLFLGSLLVLGCAPRQYNAGTTEATGGGSYTFTYHNHQWNAFRVQAGGLRLTIDTPEGDDTDPKRNMTFGFRPLVIYNRVQVELNGKTSQKAVWNGDAGVEARGQVFCRPVSEMNGPWPMKPKQFLAKFGISAELEGKTCDIDIRKPPGRPGWQPGTEVPARDLICMYAPDPAVGRSVVVLYAPFRYSEQPIQPFLNEWPEPEITLCADQDVHTVRENGVTPDPTATPTPVNTPFLLELKSLEDFRSLEGTVDGYRLTKFTWDRIDGENKVYFQNTGTFDYHLPFINAHVARFQGHLTNGEYENLLFAPMPKAITAGGIVYNAEGTIPGVTERGGFGMFLYYRDVPNIDEISTTFKRLGEAMPFAQGKLVYLFERQADFFRYRNPLKEAGVPSLPLQSFARPVQP